MHIQKHQSCSQSPRVFWSALGNDQKTRGFWERDCHNIYSLQSRRIWGYDKGRKGYEYSMPPSWMIKLKEGWGEAKKDSEGEDDGPLSATPLTRPSSTSPNSLRIQNGGLLTRVRMCPKTPALQAITYKASLPYTCSFSTACNLSSTTLERKDCVTSQKSVCKGG